MLSWPWWRVLLAGWIGINLIGCLWILWFAWRLRKED